MFPVIDVTHWERLNTEQMGTKPKFWCLDEAGEEFLFKESRSHSGEHWSEKLAEQIAAAIGLPHAEIELAVYEKKSGTISKNFLAPDDPSSLVHGNELLFEHDPNYPVDAPNFRLAQHTLTRIISGLHDSGAVLPYRFPLPENVDTACDLFVGYLLLDALIVNTDRHHANWGVVISPDGYGKYLVQIAPTFDHASSLGRELSDQKRFQKLQAQRNSSREDQTVVGYLKSDKGRSRIYLNENDDKPLHPMQVFCEAAKQFPVAADAWIKQLAKVSLVDFDALINQIPNDQMSQPAREFSLCLLDLNRTALIHRTFSYA